MNEWTLYILRCSDDTLYTGITTELERRLDEHNSDNKKASAYTRARRPLELVYKEVFENRSDASRREWEIKQLSRKEKLELIASAN